MKPGDQAFDTTRAEMRLSWKNFRCEAQDGVIIVQDPQYKNGIISDYQEVILRTEDELDQFLAARP